jgi:hypothetical protein
MAFEVLLSTNGSSDEMEQAQKIAQLMCSTPSHNKGVQEINQFH